jgi:hypothetical protein
MTLKFLALQGAPHIYDINRLRVNMQSKNEWLQKEPYVTPPSQLEQASLCIRLSDRSYKQEFARYDSDICTYLHLTFNSIIL